MLVDGTDILSRNVGNNNNLGCPVLEKNEDLTTPRRKKEISPKMKRLKI
jgi:hypothetical protein